MTPVSESQNYTRLAASGVVAGGAGGLLGIMVAAASATPTIQVKDGNNIMVGTFTPLPGQWYPMPGKFASCSLVIGGTVDCTAFWTPA